VRVSSGTRLGPYEVLSALGAGGMGEVYRARDTRLEREVAVKVLSAELLARDKEALARFRLEARAASALNHPHICTVHDVGEFEGVPFLVMEKLEGETLLERLRRGPLPPEQVLEIALGIASALAAAGARGIVHRDLKPSNVFLTAEGSAKVLDFGLARMDGGRAGAPADSQLATASPGDRDLTRPGAVVGTLAYMSPEQVRGEPLDARTDLFSLGIILYEMATGRHPFAANTAALVVDGILNRQPDVPELDKRGLPVELAGIISRALEKDARLRHQTAADLRAELLRVKSRPASHPESLSTVAPALPVPPTSFVGRSRELGLVQETLAKGRLVTLTGPGGTGKTRLALQAAHALRERYANGVFFVGLTALRDAELVDSAIAHAVGLREVPDVTLSELLVRHLAGRELLLVLDNFEQLLAAAPHVAELLAAAPRLSLLVTSRERLHIGAEAEVPVPPLAVPERTSASDVAALARSESVALFCERVAAVKPGFALSQENAATVAEICARLDGLPLAIELAAARVRHLPPAALLSRLSNRLGLLTGGARDLPARQQTLRDAIAWSHELLSAGEQALFARLGVFTGGFTLEAAEAVCAAVGPLALDTLEAVSLLVEKSLVRPLDEGDEPRYTMLETIREFALERLAACGEERRARAAHAAHFATLAAGTRERLFSGRREDQLARLDADLDNLRSALTWSLSEDPALAQAIAIDLVYFWVSRNVLGEGRGVLQKLLARIGDGVSSARARVLENIGLIHWLQGEHEAAYASLGETLEISRTLGDEAVRASALNYLSNVEESRGRHAEARRLLGESAALYRQIGDESGRAFLICNAIEPDDLSEARRETEQALALFRARGDAWNTSRALRNLAVVALRGGDFAEARRRFEEILPLQRGLGDRWHIVRSLNHLGDVVRCTGDLAAAERRYEESRREEKVLESRAHTAWSLAGLGHVALARGRLASAGRLFEQGLRSGDVSHGMSEHLAACLIGLARVRQLAGDPGGAAPLLRAAEPLVTEARRRMLPVDVALFESASAAVRTVVGDTAFEASGADAKRLGLAEVVRRGCQGLDRLPADGPTASGPSPVTPGGEA